VLTLVLTPVLKSGVMNGVIFLSSDPMYLTIYL